MNLWLLGGKDRQKSGIDMNILLWVHVKMDSQQGHTIEYRKSLLNIMWQPQWERSLGKDGYMYMYSQVLLLST